MAKTKKIVTKKDIEYRLKNDGRGIIFVGEYLGSGVKSMFQCRLGHQWMARPGIVCQGTSCPECANKNSRLSETEFIMWIKLTNERITLIGKFTNLNTKTTFECEANHRWDTTPKSIKSGRGCPECWKIRRKTITRSDAETVENFKQWLIEDDRGIETIGEYLGNSVKTEFKCKFGHTWMGLPKNIKYGIGCPKCANYGFNPSKPGWEYAFVRNGYLKIGVTNNIVNRLKTHRKYGDFIQVHERYHEDGELALRWERIIKQTYGGKYATKEQCPDGYTETFPPELLENIKSIYPKQLEISI